MTPEDDGVSPEKLLEALEEAHGKAKLKPYVERVSPPPWAWAFGRTWEGPEELAELAAKIEDLTTPHAPGSPPWIPCKNCDDWWCTIHGQHAFECPCPPADEWEPISPYGKEPATP